MRTTFLISMLASMLVFISCETDDDNPTPPGGDSQQFLTLHFNESSRKVGISTLPVLSHHPAYRSVQGGLLEKF